MIEIVDIKPFTYKCHLLPGDILRVSHITCDDCGNIEKHELAVQDIKEKALWTHSILYRLNGHLNHVIGDTATIKWLQGQTDA